MLKITYRLHRYINYQLNFIMQLNDSATEIVRIRAPISKGQWHSSVEQLDKDSITDSRIRINESIYKYTTAYIGHTGPFPTEYNFCIFYRGEAGDVICELYKGEDA